MKPLRLFLAGSAALACGVWAGLSMSQVVPSPGPPTGIACAYNTSPTTLTDKQAGWVQCDSSGKVIVSGLTGSVNNASSGVVISSTNIGAVSWLYGFNGVTWDQLQVDASKFLKVNCATGCSSGTFNNNSDNVATSATNGQAAAWLYVWDGATWDRLYGDSTNGAKVQVTNATEAITPSDAAANPTTSVPIIGFGMVWNGSTWDRLPGTTAGVKTNIAQINGVTPLMGAGATGTGSPRVTISDNNAIYETVAASQTGQALGATGAAGDYLSHCVIYPVTTSPGVVTVFDGTSSATNNVIAFAGGASSTSNLTPISIPVGAVSLNSGGWKVTTGTNAIVTCYGRFT